MTAAFTSGYVRGLALAAREAQLAIAGIDDPRERSLIAALLGVPTGGRYPPLEMPPPMHKISGWKMLMTFTMPQAT